jgi:hypothetical protein
MHLRKAYKVLHEAFKSRLTGTIYGEQNGKGYLPLEERIGPTYRFQIKEILK